MGLFDRILNRRIKKWAFAQDLNGWLPAYSQFGSNIYASDVVQQALKCIVDEIKKLNPMHVRMNGSDPVPVKDSTIQAVLQDPNPIMTTTEFIEKITWLLLLNYNVFIVPEYRVWKDRETDDERRYYESLWPIQPTQVDFLEDPTGRLYVNFWFANGTQTTLPYDDVIHIKYNYSVNQYMGGNEVGQPDHGPLLETLRVNDDLLKGVAKAMKSSYAINGLIKYNTLLDEEKMEKALADLTRRLHNNEDGFLPVDLKADFIPFERKMAVVDPETLKFMDEKILRNWGIPVDILSGDYSQDTYNAFYQKTLEPLVIAISQAFTKKLFTRRERAFGNRVAMYPKELIFLSISQTLEMINLLAPTGAIYENEKRTALGLQPLPELEGKRYMSLNWIDANNADAYQVGKVNVDVVDENKNESIMEE